MHFDEIDFNNIGVNELEDILNEYIESWSMTSNHPLAEHFVDRFTGMRDMLQKLKRAGRITPSDADYKNQGGCV